MNNKKTIYLDNAASTPLEPRVCEAMLPYLKEHFGNPSSLYSLGRTSRMAVEEARREVAGLLGAEAKEIYFTSGGTESNNTAILSAIRDLGCMHIITSPIEHHAVLHTVEHYHQWLGPGLTYLPLFPDGALNYAELDAELRKRGEEGKKCLVSLMHANNEIGTLSNLQKIGRLCESHGAVFHTDAVQTIGHYPINLSHHHIHFLSASAHKFHGPKGTGILYVNKALQAKPLIHGGGQERGMRSGTENVAGIIGFATALRIAMQEWEADRAAIEKLKRHFIIRLDRKIKDIRFNGDLKNGLYTVLSISIPRNDGSEDLPFALETAGVCVSGGSACSGGKSHVMRELGMEQEYITLRFSFSKYTTREELDTVVDMMIQSLKPFETAANV